MRFFGRNVFFLHFFAQYRPEPHWPAIAKKLYYLERVCSYICLTTTVVCSLVAVLRDDGGELALKAITIVNMLVYSSIALRNIHFVYYHNVVEYLITRMNFLMREKSALGFEPYTMKKGRDVANLVHHTWFVFALIAGLAMAASPFFQTEKKLPLQYWLFYDWTDDRYYIPTLVFQTVSQMFMVFSFANIEMFNASFTILLRYQFKLIGDDFKHVFSNALFQTGMSRTCVEDFLKNREDMKWINKIQKIADTENFKIVVLNNLKYCIQRHQEMLTFRDEFYDFISFQLSTELLFLLGYLIFSLFTVTITDDHTVYFALSQYFGGTVCQIYMMCVFGEKLTMEVDELKTTLYDLPWYFCDKEFRRNVFFIQMQMTKNDYLKAGKLLNMSLEIFLEFMKKAASFFAVLRQVNGEN